MKKIIFAILLSVLFVANVNAEEVITANTGEKFSIEYPKEAMQDDMKISDAILKIPKIYENDIIIPDSACDLKTTDDENGYIICEIFEESDIKKFEGIEVKRAYDMYHFNINWYKNENTLDGKSYILQAFESDAELKTDFVKLEGNVGGNITLKDKRVTKTEGGHGYFRHNINNGLTPSREYDYIDEKFRDHILSMKDDVTATFTFTLPGLYDIVSYYTVPGANGKKITYQTTYNIDIKDPNDNGSGENYIEKKYNKTLNVLVGEKFTIKKNEEATEKNMELVFNQLLATKKIVNVEKGECFDSQNQQVCIIENDEWNISISKAGIYTLYNYSYINEIDKSNTWTTIETKYEIIVSEPVEVKKDDTKVVVDNENVMEYISDEQVVTDIKIEKDSKVEVLEVKKEIFTVAKEKNIDLVYEVKNADDKLAYSWTFEAKKLENKHDKELNLMIKTNEISEELAKKFNKKNAYSLQFAYHGILPGATKVKIYVGNKYEPNSLLDLYYNNQEQKKIESIAKKIKVDNEGYVTIEINHCSEYILTRADDKMLDEEPKMGDTVKLNYLTMLIGALGLGVMIKKRF